MDASAFLARVAAYQEAGWRLAIINATTVIPGADPEAEAGAFDVSWSFATDVRLEHIRLRVHPGEEVPSISEWFGAAFLYENEMRELFGINVTGIAVDLRGQLYKTADIVPFAPSAIKARLEAARGAAEAAKTTKATTDASNGADAARPTVDAAKGGGADAATSGPARTQA